MVLKTRIARSLNDLDLAYLPYGVTTLMIRIENDNRQHNLVVRPANRSVPPEYIGHESLRDGKNVYSKDIKIIWGGGMTKGFELDLVPNRVTNLYYLVIHDATNLATYTFNLEIIEIVGGEEKLLDSKPINLKPSNEYKANSSKMTISFDSVYRRCATIQGRYTPDYQSRWFGNENYRFNEYNLPEFILTYQVEPGEYIASNIDISIRSKKGNNKIAKIGGDLERSNFHAELFNFTSNYCVLRVWLYWVNDLFSGNRLMNGTESGSRGNTELRSWKAQVIEVPDVERFDLVINKQTQKVSYVGTDLHWRETWWSVNGDLAQLKFAQLELVPILIKNLPQILKPHLIKRRQEKSETFDPAKQLMQKLSKSELPSGEASFSVTDDTQRVNAATDTKLGHGLHRKHVPYVLDFSLMPLYVSDVLTDL